MKYTKETYKNTKYLNNITVVERTAYLRQQEIIEKLRDNKSKKKNW